MDISTFRGNPGLLAAVFCAMWLGTLLRVSQAAVYTNDWAIRIVACEEAVKRMAEKHGFTNLGQVSWK